MEQQFVTATTLIDDDSERPTIPSLRPRQRPKIRKKTSSLTPPPRKARFDAHAEHFFSNAETVPALVPDARYLAELELLRPEGEDDATAWWLEQRRRRNLRLVLLLGVVCVALVVAGVLR